jgi:RNA polymerase subunit RPABC4/transcription elongation factor Spt4
LAKISKDLLLFYALLFVSIHPIDGRPYGQCSAILLKLQFKSIAPAQGFVNRNFEAQWKVCQRWIAMKTKTCPDCNGDGVVDKGTDDEHQCPMCGGSGVVPDDDDDEEVIRTSRA